MTLRTCTTAVVNLAPDHSYTDRSAIDPIQAPGASRLRDQVQRGGAGFAHIQHGRSTDKEQNEAGRSLLGHLDHLESDLRKSEKESGGKARGERGS